MSHRLLIVTGHDRPGIVNAVSGLLAKQNINLEDLRMSVLEGEFAMMVIVKMTPKVNFTALERELKKIERQWKLTLFQCPLGSLNGSKRKNKKPAMSFQSVGKKTFVIRVLSRDKKGIVAGVSRCLARFGFNITDLQCRILGKGTKALYAMVLECDAPVKADASALRRSLNQIAKRLDMDVSLQEADTVQF